MSKTDSKPTIAWADPPAPKDKKKRPKTQAELTIEAFLAAQRSIREQVAP